MRKFMQACIVLGLLSFVFVACSGDDNQPYDEQTTTTLETSLTEQVEQTTTEPARSSLQPVGVIEISPEFYNEDIPSGAVQMTFIYEEDCAACLNGREVFGVAIRRYIEDVTERFPFELHTLNILHSGATEEFAKIAYDLAGLDSTTLELPVLFINGQVLQGWTSIRGNLREAYLTAATDLFINNYVFNPRYALTGPNLFDNFDINPEELTLVYFYRQVCPACVEIAPYVNAIPDYVMIDGQAVAVNLIRVNTRSGNNRDRAIAFFDHYQVPDDMRSVPIIFTADSFYVGTEAIPQMLETLGQPQQVGMILPE